MTSGPIRRLWEAACLGAVSAAADPHRRPDRRAAAEVRTALERICKLEENENPALGRRLLKPRGKKGELR